MDPFRKKPRSDAPSTGHATAGPDERECRLFHTPEGCPYGDECRFDHVPTRTVPATKPAIAPAAESPPFEESDLTQPQSTSKWRTKPCKRFFSTSGCPFGEDCHFLHYAPGRVEALGVSPLPKLASSARFPSGELSPRKVIGGGDGSLTGLAARASPDEIGRFKTRLCKRYGTPEGCRFGEKCYFAHGEKELRKSKVAGGPSELESLMDPSCRGLAPPPTTSGSQLRSQNVGRLFPKEGPYGRGHGSGERGYDLRESTAPDKADVASFGASSSVKISIEASVASDIIGKGGANVRHIHGLTGAKLFIREHDTDATLRIVEMKGSLDQIKQAGQMVRQVLINLPQKFKTKMCERYAHGICRFGDKCRFAHGHHEMQGA